jgi:hypothetical protein
VVVTRQPHLQPHSNQGQQAPTGIDPMITKTFIIAKLFRAQGTNFLRQEKNIRYHGNAASRGSPG